MLPRFSSTGTAVRSARRTMWFWIRRIQDHIIARAHRTGVPVVESSNLDAAIGSVIDLVLAAAEQVQPVQ